MYHTSHIQIPQIYIPLPSTPQLLSNSMIVNRDIVVQIKHVGRLLLYSIHWHIHRYCRRGSWRSSVLNAIVRGVYGMVPVLGVGGIPRISQFSFPLSRVGEESLSESSDTDVLSASVGIRAQIVRPKLAKMMALLTVSSGHSIDDESGDCSQHNGSAGK